MFIQNQSKIVGTSYEILANLNIMFSQLRLDHIYMYLSMWGISKMVSH